MPQFLPAIGAFFATGAGETTAAALASTALGVGASELLKPKTPNINIPPPPGATMIDAAGQAAAANERRRAAAAGGLQSTVTGAGLQPAASGGPTSGAKQLSGQ